MSDKGADQATDDEFQFEKSDKKQTSEHAFYPRCAGLLLEGGAEVNVRMRESRLTPLHVAARRGLEEHVDLFLRYGADVLATSQEGETPLNAACSSAERPSQAGRYLRVIQKLLDAGADPTTAGRKQHTPLHNACSNCSPRIVDVLLQHGARADVTNCAGYTPMDCLLQVDGNDQVGGGLKICVHGGGKINICLLFKGG